MNFVHARQFLCSNLTNFIFSYQISIDTNCCYVQKMQVVNHRRPVTGANRQRHQELLEHQAQEEINGTHPFKTHQIFTAALFKPLPNTASLSL